MMTSNICQYLDPQKPILADGAMGTLLLAQGFGQYLEKLNLENPDLIQRAHELYRKAGARLHYTHTFQANPVHYEKDYAHIIEAALKNLKAVSDPEDFVAGNIGPMGQSDFYIKDTIACFLEYGVDLLAFETFTNPKEIEEVLKNLGGLDVPVMFSVSLDPEGDIEPFVDLLNAREVAIAGLNCSYEPKKMYPIFEALRGKVKKPFAVKLNAGLPLYENKKWTYHVSPDAYAGQLRPYLDVGVEIIGGCCGTTPEYVAEIGKTIERYRLNRDV